MAPVGSRMRLKVSRTTVDFVLWIPFGAAVACVIARRFITRRVARLLEEALARKPSPAEWNYTKNYLSSYRLGIYIVVALGGALIGACIGALAFVVE
jgi:hypothetical protein